MSFEGPRDFTHITPLGRRLTEYEATNCSLQTNPEGADVPGWFSAYANGRGAWQADLTRMRSSDWFAFRDPAQMWQRVYIRQQADQERAIARTTDHAVATGLLDRLDHTWCREALGNVYVPFAFFEDGLFRAFAYAQREALSDTIAGACTFNSTDKARHAQDIILYHLELIHAAAPIRPDDGAELWMHHEPFQPIRRLVERLLATDDWAEIAFAANLLIEPLLAATVYQDILLWGAPASGDLVTPLILMEAERDRLRNAAWTAQMVTMLLGDQKFAEPNRAVVGDWVGSWYPEVDAALETLSGWAPLAGRLPDDVVAAARARWERAVTALGLEPQMTGGRS